jgi:hypothetical protein
MNKPKTTPQEKVIEPGTQLLEAIKTLRASVGDGLNDDEFTRLLRQSALPTEAGFDFLSYSDGCVTLTVPRQDPADWYPEEGWIRPAKEEIARAIAEKHGLTLCEPPDQSSNFLFPAADPPFESRHHLELINQVETVVVAHPQYLKVRVYGAASVARYLWSAQAPLSLGPELLADLAALYRS